MLHIYASPEDCYLALRGLKTLLVRLKQYEKSVLAVAKWFTNVNIIDKVLHPVLPDHPEHHLWKRDFKGSSGLFAFTFKEDYPEEKTGLFIDSLDLFGIGYSWGGYKSLITAGKYKRHFKSRYHDKTIFCLNIGLEDYEDLMGDLENGFNTLK